MYLILQLKINIQNEMCRNSWKGVKGGGEALSLKLGIPKIHIPHLTCLKYLLTGNDYCIW